MRCKLLLAEPVRCRQEYVIDLAGGDRHAMVREQFLDLRLRHPANTQRVDRDEGVGRKLAGPSVRELRDGPSLRWRDVLMESDQNVVSDDPHTGERPIDEPIRRGIRRPTAHGNVVHDHLIWHKRRTRTSLTATARCQLRCHSRSRPTALRCTLGLSLLSQSFVLALARHATPTRSRLRGKLLAEHAVFLREACVLSTQLLQLASLVVRQVVVVRVRAHDPVKNSAPHERQKTGTL